jgi:hypothetical protein
LEWQAWVSWEFWAVESFEEKILSQPWELTEVSYGECENEIWLQISSLMKELGLTPPSCFQIVTNELELIPYYEGFV